MDTSLSPLPNRAFAAAHVRHLLLRTGFGGTPGQVRELARLGCEAAVDKVLAGDAGGAAALPEPPVDPDVLRPPSAEQRQRYRAARRAGEQDVLEEARERQLRARADDRRMAQALQRWWLQRLAEGPDPFTEKLVLLWHSHFATGYRQVRDAYLMQQQQALFRDHALNFEFLVRGIVRDPAMIRYLNNDRNNRHRPNENLARELMELFTLGEGHYTEQDIREGARALTGFTFHDNDFVFRAQQHDPGRKTILGKTGTFDGDDFAKLLLLRAQCPVYVALKLYRHYVADVSEYIEDVPAPQRAVVADLGRMVARERYTLKPVLRTLLRSRHFYDAAIVGRKIKSPAELVFGTVRQLAAPARDMRAVQQAMSVMGQALYQPPSVAGWPVGRAWINTSTLFARQNTCTLLLTGKAPGGGWDADDMAYDPMPLLEGLGDRSPAAVTDFLVDHALGEHVPAARRKALHDFMAGREKGVTRDSVVALLLLITAMPEYQLC